MLAALLALTLGCGRRFPAPEPTGENAVDPAWVTIYRPELAAPGFTLTLHEARIPVLLDLNGRPVHSWPAARVKSRVRLLPDGSILGLGLGRSVVEYDWEGRKTWEFRTPGALPHHDVIRLANGHTLVLMLKDGEGSDTLLEVDRGGRVVWIWRAAEHLGALLPAHPAHPHDATHINSIQELPDNPWHAAGDRRFRPGNLLVSARNLNTLFVVDRSTGEVVWSFSDGLDRQHEAVMNGPGLPGAGLIQVFNNRLQSFQGDHRSEVLELDPHDGRVAWSYRAPGFFSPTSGLEQALPNGNVLITSTRGGRVFEVTRRGEIAWEWTPPYEPVRAVRVGAASCPQLARLAVSRKAVVPPPGYRHVDPDAYRFARQGSRVKAVVAGEPRTVLKEEDDCRDLTLPAAAELAVAYGVDRERQKAVGRADRPAAFTLRLTPEGGAAIELLHDAVGAAGPAWRERTLPLDAYALRAVRLCVEIDGPGSSAGPKERFAFWEQPRIAVRGQARQGEGDGDDETARAPQDLTPEELEVRRQHLKSLGYVN
jgi:hypothetical protein